MLQTQPGMEHIGQNKAYSGFNTTLAFSGSDVSVSVGSYILDAVSFFQLTPQQIMTPVYSIFESKPAGFLQGNQLIRGVLGLNMRFVNYFESLATLPATKMFIQILENGVVNVHEMVVTFRGRDYKPAITLSDVYIFGGSMSANVEGTPIQVVHEFVASDMLKSDTLDAMYYDTLKEETTNQQTYNTAAKSAPNKLPSIKPLQGKFVTLNSTNNLQVQPDSSINLATDRYLKLANAKATNQDAVRNYMRKYVGTNMGYYTNGVVNNDGTQNAVLFDSKGNNINAAMIRDGVAAYTPDINVGEGYNSYMKAITR